MIEDFNRPIKEFHSKLEDWHNARQKVLSSLRMQREEEQREKAKVREALKRLQLKKARAGLNGYMPDDPINYGGRKI